MKKILLSILCLFFSLSSFSQMSESSNQMQRKAVSAEQAEKEFIEIARKIPIDIIRRTATQQNGRVKPFDTLARESILYINGKYSRWGLHAVQMYLALTIYESSPWLEFIEVREPTLRTELGFLTTKKYFSLADLESSTLQSLTMPLFKKQQANAKSLTEHEKKILETFQQMSLLQQIILGDHLDQAIDFAIFDKSKNPEAQVKINQYLKAVAENNSAEMTSKAEELVQWSQNQKTPDMYQHYIGKINTEIFYNDFRPFLWASILYIILGFVFFTPVIHSKLSHKGAIIFFVVPLLLQSIGLALRVYITQFAPVTNMFGTMIWVSMGVNIFSLVLFILYRNYLVSGITLMASGLILFLAESIPLILNPDMDPIVAVLRSNFWLSTHVTTITISYAALTIAMLIGNMALIRMWTHHDNQKFYKEYAHYAYRMVQLGCFLLTAGIILGGVWADYSWGRFWGWDPKETWALIADLAFLVLLHARYAGWVSDFSFLALAPISYLTVIMAWYGVNFILAAGLHSYGFSSGGATMVAIFVGIQVLLLAAGFLKRKMIKA